MYHLSVRETNFGEWCALAAAPRRRSREHERVIKSNHKLFLSRPQSAPLALEENSQFGNRETVRGRAFGSWPTLACWCKLCPKSDFTPGSPRKRIRGVSGHWINLILAHSRMKWNRNRVKKWSTCVTNPSTNIASSRMRADILLEILLHKDTE